MDSKEIEKLASEQKLHYASQRGDYEDAKKLINEGWDVNMFDDLGMTPLHYAAVKGHKNIISLLIENGAEVNARDERGDENTPIREASYQCDLEVAELLIRNGADPYIKGWMRMNAVDVIEERDDVDAEKILELIRKLENS